MHIISIKYLSNIRAFAFAAFFLFWGAADSLAQYTIQIVDGTNTPLIGVNVYNDSQSFVAVSDIDGKVEVDNISYSEKINFSYIGFNVVSLPIFEIRKRGFKIKLRPALDILPSITVVGRRDEKPQEIPYKVGMVGKEKIEHFNSQTTADALAQNENVFVQKSQMGGGSINIRGFEANKVLLVVDGVRMNNIVYRNGHLQDAIKVDNNALEQIEVFYGPGSLNYGSDALGGVVQFRTKDPKLYQGEDDSKDYESNSNGLLRFSSANFEKTVHADVNYGTRDWATFTSFTFTDYDDLRTGAIRPEKYPDYNKREWFADRVNGDDTFIETLDPNVLTGTAYAQFDFLQKVKYQKSKNQFYLFNFQYSNSSNVPRYDFLSEEKNGLPKWTTWYYGPQQRFFLSAKSQTFKRTKFFNKMTLIAGAQKLDEDRHKRKFTDPTEEFTLEDIYAFSLTGDFQKNFGDRLALIYGADLNHNILFSTAGQVDINSEQITGGVMTRYPSGGSDMSLLASYANARYMSRDSVFTAFGGLRYTFANLMARYERRPDDPIQFPAYFYNRPFISNNQALTWSLGLTINTKSGWQAKASASTAFHAPNIDDLAKFRTADSRENRVLVPNLQLKPERTINTELTLGKSFGNLNKKDGTGAMISVSGYYTLLADGIVRDLTSLNGDTTLVLDDGTVLRYVANVNKEQARIIGGSGDFKMKYRKFEAFSGFGFTQGRVLEGGEDVGPLDHIPPLFAKGGLQYANKNMRFTFVVHHNALKPLDEFGGGSDNAEYFPEEGALAWTTYNLYSSIKLTRKFSLDASVENILDQHYRVFSAGVPAPGRNFIIALRGNF